MTIEELDRLEGAALRERDGSKNLDLFRMEVGLAYRGMRAALFAAKEWLEADDAYGAEMENGYVHVSRESLRAKLKEVGL